MDAPLVISVFLNSLALCFVCDQITVWFISAILYHFVAVHE